MDEYLVQGAVGMSRGSMLRIDDGCDIVVYVWEGEIWLTQERDRRDHMLRAGDWFRLDRDGPAIAHSLRRTVISLTSLHPEHQAGRVQLFRAGDPEPAVLYRARTGRLGMMLARVLQEWTSLFAPRARPTTASL